jgi:Na+/H+ antiporter NhaC
LSQGHATAVVLILPVVSLVLWVWGSPLAGQMDAASLLGRITGRFFVAFLISLFIFFLIRKTRGSKQ